METLLIISLLISIIINILLSIYFKNTFFDLIPKYENFIINLNEKFKVGYEKLKMIDIKNKFTDENGLFESDDEIGLVYNQIKIIIEDLNKFLYK